MPWIPQTILADILENKTRLLLFAACQSGAGATHAVIECALELDKQYPNVRILLADFRLTNNALSERALPAPGWQESLKAGNSVLGSLTKLRGNGNIAVFASTAKAAGACSAAEADSAFEKLLRETAGKFDLVLIDTPPILPEQNGAFLYHKSNGIVLVVEAGQTRRPVIKEAAAAVEKMGGNLLGVLLNRRKKLIPQWIYQRFF